MKKNRNSTGFTAVELVVIVAFISIMVIIVISNFSTIRQQFALRRVAYKFDQDLRKAQNLALSAIKYEDSEGNSQTVTGYGVYLNINTLGDKKYIIYADQITEMINFFGILLPTGNKYYDDLDYLVETVDFGQAEPGVIIKEIKVSETVNEISVNFNSFDNTVLISIPDPYEVKNSLDVVFALESDLTKTLTVSVNQSGSITVK